MEEAEECLVKVFKKHAGLSIVVIKPFVSIFYIDVILWKAGSCQMRLSCSRGSIDEYSLWFIGGSDQIGSKLERGDILGEVCEAED